MRAKFFQRTADAFAGGVFVRAKRVADFSQAALFHKAQQQGIPIFAIEFVERAIEQWADLFPIGSGFGFN